MNLDFILGNKVFSLTEAGKNRRGGMASADPMAMLGNDDEPRRKPSSRGGGGSTLAPSVPASSFTPPIAASAPASPSAAAAPRSPLQIKAGLASGSQAAVVKIASFSAGRGSVSRLVNYQSRDGQLEVELDDGLKLRGKEQMRALIDSLAADGSTREKSKDVLSFSVMLHDQTPHDQTPQDRTLKDRTLKDRHTPAEIERALATSLAGHRYAWREEQSGGQQVVHVVATAASSRRENGKLFRLYDNGKSLDGLEDRFSAAFNGEAVIEGQKWRHGMQGANEALYALTKGGTHPVETDDNLYLRHEKMTQQKMGQRLAKSWERGLRSNSPRDVAHLIMSAKPGTHEQAFVSAVRATLRREFDTHSYAFVLHKDKEHLHVHVALRMQNHGGQRLDPNIQDLRRWREILAEEARARQIPMEATSRFDQAHTPAYKLKDIKMLERGTAPDAVRRRIEAVTTREVHRPIREEGKLRAQANAGQWQQVAQAVASPASLPPDHIRLYRGESGNASSHRAPIFTTDRAAAEGFAGAAGRVSYLDVTKAQFDDLPKSRRDASRFVVDSQLATEARELPRHNPAQVLPFAQRAQAADRQGHDERIKPAREPTSVQPPNSSLAASIASWTAMTQQLQKEGPTDMSIEAMNEHLTTIKTTLDGIASYIPPEKREQFDQDREMMVARYEKQLAAYREIAASNPTLEGAGAKPHEPRNFEDFTYELRGGQALYQQHDDTGQRQNVAFVDKGSSLEIWKRDDDKTILAALQVASEKWETIQVAGSDSYKQTVVKLAAEHGFNVTNPELQDRIQAERERLASERSKSESNLRAIQSDIIREAGIERGEAAQNSRAQPDPDQATRSEAAIAEKNAQNVADGSRNPIVAEPGATQRINGLAAEQQRQLQRLERLEQARPQPDVPAAAPPQKSYRGQK